MIWLLLQQLRQQYSKIMAIGDLFFLPHGIKIKLEVGNYLTKNNPLRDMHHCADSIFIVDYLPEYESMFKIALAHESVDPSVLLDEKSRGL
jgi:hypothetical protein